MWRPLLLALTLLAPPATWAVREECATSQMEQTADEVWVASCISTCTQISKVNTQTAQDFYRANCRHFRETENRERTIWDLFAAGGKLVEQWGRCLVGGAVKAAVGIPMLVWDIVTSDWGSNDDSPFVEPSEQFKTCFAEVECRRELGRHTLALLMASDAEVDRAMERMSSDELRQRIFDERQIVQSTCQFHYDQIRTQALNSAPNGWTFELEQQIYERMTSERKTCAAVMNLQPPRPPEPPRPPRTMAQCVAESPNPYLECLNTVEKIAVGVACMGPEFREKVEELTVDKCGDIVSVLVPVPFVGPQTSWTRPAVSTGTATRGTAAAVRTLDNEAETLARSADTLAAETLEARIAFTNTYRSRVFATPEQNASFIASVDDPARLAIENKTRIFDSENSMMKTLNDVTHDKNLVTSLTNYQKELLLRNLAELKAKYPGMQFDIYSDFKSIKIAIRNDSAFTPPLSDQLLADLNALYAKTNQEFAAEMTRLGIVVPEAGEATGWMRAGYGRNVDEAALAARRARTLDGSPRVLDFYSPEVREQMTTRLTEVESMRVELSQSTRFSPLFERSASGVQLPRQEVFDFVRKNAGNEELAAAVRTRYGLTTFTAADAERLRAYVSGVDEFSPTLLIGRRENANLDQALAGGMTADFLGMGAANLRATAEGIAGRTDLITALRGAREGERSVTAAFRARMETFRGIVGGNVVCSGDDCVRLSTTALTAVQKQNMLNNIARNADVRGIRVAFVGPGVPQNFRMQLAAQGEAMEKALRQELQSSGFSPTRLGQLTFGLDMQTVTLNQGTVNLIIGKANSVTLTSAEQLAIQQAFASAITKVNGQTSAYIEGTTQLREATLFLVPGAGLVNTVSGEQ